MNIEAIGRIAGPTGPLGPTGVQASGAAGGADFADTLAQGVEQLQATQANADGLAVKAATGSLTDVHDYMIASTQASLATQLTTAVRDKAVAAFTEIMRMQA
ncbi:flagellar hook-basal body complex protein FliE [Spirillospora albida]|uniref:flagellar hook-basal body complex protein FliE n=1 Tax=Spirillospora albida TaxID=58123 RepID=UPI0004BEF6B2|nr:flagellar hook-basal body complex protein FliE [Spirillospora albida]